MVPKALEPARHCEHDDVWPPLFHVEHWGPPIVGPNALKASARLSFDDRLLPKLDENPVPRKGDANARDIGK